MRSETQSTTGTVDKNPMKITKMIRKSKSKKQVKVFFMSIDQLKQKKANLEKKIESLQGAGFKKKRANTYKVKNS